MRLRLINAFLFLCCSLVSAENWQEHWIKAVQFCQTKEYTSAEYHFTVAINELEREEIVLYPHVYVDRARLYSLLQRHSEALLDLNVALSSHYLEGRDKIRAVVTRLMTYTNLGLEEKIESEMQYLKSICPDFPSTEFSDDRIIIRNMPECECYKKIITAYLLHAEICESENDIQMLKSGVCIIKRKKCGCDSFSAKSEKRKKEATCKKWCDKIAFTANGWCAKTFKRLECQQACLAAVEFIKDGCHWCCEGGDFYGKCVKPFEDIISQMGMRCDPAWD